MSSDEVMRRLGQTYREAGIGDGKGLPGNLPIADPSAERIGLAEGEAKLPPVQIAWCGKCCMTWAQWKKATLRTRCLHCGSTFEAFYLPAEGEQADA